MYRLKICKSNVCNYYDPVGKSEKCYVRGEGCCTGCGCKDTFKTSSLSSHCYLKDIGQKPLWESVMTEKQEEVFREKTGLK